MIWAWVGFILFVVALLAFDLGLLNRRPRAIPLRRAILLSLMWIGISLAFTFVIYDGYAHHRFGLGTAPDAVDGRINNGASASIKFLTGYLLEKTLSIDNLFVIAVIFRMLAVPAPHQHRVLFWGIFGAMALRGVLIGAGAGLVAHYHWVLYIFGVFLLWSGARLLTMGRKPPGTWHDPVPRIVRKVLPLTSRFDGGRFITIENGRGMLTPLALALVLIELADVAFAADSIPAVFGVTADPLLVFTSNILAILGLRALYFALAGLLDKFHLLRISLALVLLLIGAKILAGHWLARWAGPYLTLYLLGAVGILLAGGIIASLAMPPRDEALGGSNDLSVGRD